MSTRMWKALPFTLALAAACGSTEQGARLEGMLDPASVSAVRGTPVQVSIVGTPHATSSDSSGRFGFDGLEPGDATVRFRGPGFDVRVRISGLRRGETMQITVRVDGRGCVVRGGQDDEIALVAPIGAVAASSITVSGIEVDVDARTRIGDRASRLALSDLHAGDVIAVEGALQAGGKVLARVVERLTASGVAEALLRGLVGSVDAATSSFSISGLRVATDASSRLVGISAFSDLAAGDRVVAEGALQADGSVKARLVVKLPAMPPRPPRDEDVELEGSITSVTAPDRFEVAGKTVVVDSSTRFEGEHDQPLTFADLKTGDRVEVEGTAQADGTFLAREVEREDEDDHHE